MSAKSSLDFVLEIPDRFLEISDAVVIVFEVCSEDVLASVTKAEVQLAGNFDYLKPLVLRVVLRVVDLFHRDLPLVVGESLATDSRCVLLKCATNQSAPVPRGPAALVP